LFQLSVAPLKSDVVVIFFGSTAILTEDGQFFVVPMLHSVGDIISQGVAVLLATKARFTFLSFITPFHYTPEDVYLEVFYNLPPKRVSFDPPQKRICL